MFVLQGQCINCGCNESCLTLTIMSKHKHRANTIRLLIIDESVPSTSPFKHPPPFTSPAVVGHLC